MHKNVVTPNLTPIGSLTLPFKKKVAEHIDNENLKMIKRIITTGPEFSVKRLEEKFKEHQKFKKMLKKGARNGQGFDLEKMDEHRRRVYGNIECKTSSQLFPPISKRSQSQFQKLGGDYSE